MNSCMDAVSSIMRCSFLIVKQCNYRIIMYIVSIQGVWEAHEYFDF